MSNVNGHMEALREIVRLRGEVGERRVAQSAPISWYAVSRRRIKGDRRQSHSVAARFDECMAITREPLLRLIEEQSAEIERLRAAVSKAAAIAASVHMLAAGAGAGEAVGE